MASTLQYLRNSAFALLLVTLVLSGAAQAAVWATKAVDKFGDQGLDNSLALDSKGIPHVSYREFDWYRVTDFLKYASWNGISWNVEYVDKVGDTGFATSLAIDSSDRPRIAYHDSALNIKVASKDGGTWKVTTVAKGANPFLTVDSNDRPHLSFVKPYFGSYYDLRSSTKQAIQQSDLMYAYWDGQSWQVQTVERGGRIGDDNCLALDSKGRPHIAYRDFGLTAPVLKYATWDGARWNISVVDSDLTETLDPWFNGQNFSIALDSNDRPCISYMGPKYSLKYARWNGQGWQFDIVDSHPAMYELPNSLALDAADNPHILYYDAYQVPPALRYAEWDGTSWQLDVIESGNVPGLRNSLKMDRNGMPLVSYYVQINGEGGGALYFASPGEVGKVTAVPAGGLYDAPQQVTLSTGNILDSIYYTTDGTTPTRASAKFNRVTPITVPANTTTTLRFFSVDAKGNESEPGTEIYTVDTTTPIYTLTLNKGGSGDGGVLVDNVAVPWVNFAITAKYRAGTTVTLTPQATFGSVFSGWSGACTGADTCEITMDGSKTAGASYKAMLASDGFVAVAAGVYHSLVANSDGMIAGWGYNDNGQVGDGTTTGKSSPAPVPGSRGAKAVSAGAGHSIALMADGSVVGWGLNLSGQLGDGTKTSRSTPAPVNGLSDIIAISAGYGHSLALKRDGTVYSWGYNYNGQLGDGTKSDRSVPVRVPGLSGIKAIAAGTSHSLALKSDGTVVSWGYNGNGQLGIGSTVQREAPTAVAGVSGVASISAGANHSLALRDDGTVYGWGLNTSYQLGDWGFFQQLTPKSIPGLTGITAISAGGLHSVALKKDGTVMAWGDNNNGQLGDGTTTSRITPLPVPAISGIAAISAGMYHTVALGEDSMVLAWGLNGYGQIGDGTTSPRTSPVQVQFTLNPFTISVPVTENGSISCTTPVSYNSASICTITAAPGFKVATLTVNGVDRLAALAGNFFTIEKVQANQVVAATFASSDALPGPPQGISANAGNGKATVTFTPASGGTGPITGYHVTSYPPGGLDLQDGTLSTVHTVTGLSNGTTYTFVVTATNGIGTGPASTFSNPVTPSTAQTTTGDCDNSGTVTVAEVRSAIEVFLGLKPVSGCVDLDGDGSVSLSELQKVMNAHLGLAP